MPRVSDDHLAARRAQIVAAAKECFSREGFHRTSMADVFAESGLSAGAVYRYFRSKDELIAAIAGQAGEGLRAVTAEMVAADPVPDPATALLGVLQFVETQAQPGGSLRIALQVWAEALRDESLREQVGRTYDGLREGFIAICQRNVADGRLPVGTDAGALGRILYNVVPGYVLQRLLLDDHLEPQPFVADLRPLLETLSVR
jgi:AcrR family transcriptional regulator